ncbi:MAG: hypothetical protein A2808_02540 [Candidatus Moranbacteria bacterium RIFCSPHIGHO2_01_FULL_55_24]|nr:MAG: hypothetical protein A2808_02540 [Candidatus Moranbacteria bacterium RIFCSPHIGHO2_01_FULL_55_24]
MNGKNILITGAGGTVGLILTRFFLGEGFRVYVVDRAEEGAARLLDMQRISGNGKSLYVLFGDVLEESFLENFLGQTEISYIIHCAALKHFSVGVAFPEKVMTENVEVFKRVRDIAKKHTGVRKVILCSSDKAAKPLSAMGASKKAIEDLSRESDIEGVDFINIRFGNILYSNGSVLEKLENHIQRGEAFTIRNQEMTRYILTESDVVDLVEYALNSGVHGDVICIETPSIKITELVEGYLKKRKATIPVVLGENSFAESIHEALFNEEEVPCVSKNGQFFVYNKKHKGDLNENDRDYVLSSEHALSEEALKKIYE